MNFKRRFREDDLEHVSSRDNGWTGIGISLACSSWAWTFIDDDGPWAICGAIRRWDGCGSVWMQIDKRMHGIDKHVFMTKACKNLLQQYCEEHDVERLDCIVDAGFAGYDRWAEVLGFEYEYTMKNASPGCKSDILGFVFWRKR